MRAVEIYGEILSKAGGAGSRGGNVIGHTRSGKPVYAHDHASNAKISKVPTMPSGYDNNHQSQRRLQETIRAHGNYSAADHKEAGALHAKSSQAAGDTHDRLAAGHDMAHGFLSHRSRASSQTPR